MNVKNFANDKLNANERFSQIREILGLKMKAPQQLRYGKILIMTDQDFDGFHIKGLVINLFHTFWKELIQGGFVYSYRTPVVKIFSQKKLVKSFYNFN